jgi:hypothetical protein
MRKSLADDREAVPATARRARKVQHERRAAHAGDAPGEETVGRPAEGVGPNRLRKPRHLALDDRGGRLRGDVPRRHTGSAGRDHELGLVGELLDRSGDLAPIVGDDAALDLVALVFEQLLEEGAALVSSLSARDAVRDRQDGGSQTSSFVFSRSLTSVNVIESSTAFAMS